MINPEEFPTVFKNGIPQNGFRVGKGWVELLRAAFVKIEIFLREHPEYQESFKLVEIKSKFGVLRVYAQAGAEAINEALDQAMDLSGRTCETCGDVAYEHTSTAYYTSCFEHGPKTLIQPD